MKRLGRRIRMSAKVQSSHNMNGKTSSAQHRIIRGGRGCIMWHCREELLVAFVYYFPNVRQSRLIAECTLRIMPRPFTESTCLTGSSMSRWVVGWLMIFLASRIACVYKSNCSTTCLSRYFDELKSSSAGRVKDVYTSRVGLSTSEVHLLRHHMTAGS